MRCILFSWFTLLVLIVSNFVATILNDRQIFTNNLKTNEIMTIEGVNGNKYSATSQAQGALNTVLGSIGTAGALLGGGGLFSNMFNNNGGCNARNNGAAMCSDDEFVTRYEAQQDRVIAEKDSQIALLQAEKNTDKKMIEVYAELAAKDTQMRNRIEAVEKDLNAKIDSERDARIFAIQQERESRLLAEKEQAVFNQSMIGTTSTMASQIKQLQTITGEITTSVVPQNKVCATGCCGCACD